MEKPNTNEDKSVRWINPATKKYVPGARLTAVAGDIPGLRLGGTRELHPSIKGVMPDGRMLHAFFMNSEDGPIVGISEIPTAPDSRPDL